MTEYDFDDEDDSKDTARSLGPPWTEFECPECTADNSYTDGFTVKDEVTCTECGMPWRVRKTETGFRLVEP